MTLAQWINNQIFETTKHINMDIFGDDIDSYYNNGELNENINGENIEEAEEDNAAEKDDEEKTDENGEPIKVEPKKRSVRRPQVSWLSQITLIYIYFYYFLKIKN